MEKDNVSVNPSGPGIELNVLQLNSFCERVKSKSKVMNPFLLQSCLLFIHEFCSGIGTRSFILSDALL